MANARKMWQDSTPSHENQETIKSFRHFLESCFGPRGGVKMLVTEGGHLVVTSASSQLLRYMCFSDPIIKVLLNFMKSQQCAFEDNGLYIGIVSSFLIEQYWTHGHVTSQKALKFICERCIALLETGSTKAGLSSIGHMLAITNSVLASKPGCTLTNEDRRHLSVNLVKGFLSSVGDEAETQGLGQVVTVTYSGPSSQATELLDGILYPYPEEESLTLELCKQLGPWPILLYTCMLNSPPTVAQEADVSNQNITIYKLHHNINYVLFY
jgi:hypothetical protein